jgi:hypothetical protein
MAVRRSKLLRARQQLGGAGEQAAGGAAVQHAIGRS